MEEQKPKKMRLQVYSSPPVEIGEGDRVIMLQNRNMGPPNLFVSTVTKVLGNSSRWVRVDRYGEYNDRGLSRGQSFSQYRLVSFDQALLDRNVEERRQYDERQALLRRVSSTNFERALDYPELRPMLLMIMEKLEAKKS